MLQGIAKRYGARAVWDTGLSMFGFPPILNISVFQALQIEGKLHASHREKC